MGSARAGQGRISGVMSLLIAAAAAASMASYWITIRAVLPQLKLRQAAAVNLGSNAVANTLPAGGALAMGISWAMLSSWGLSTADYVLYTLVTGIWNVFTLLGMPVLALLVMATATRPGAVLITAATVASYLALWLVLLACLRGTGRAVSQRPGDSRRAAVQGGHLPAPHPPRRPGLPHVAARPRFPRHQPAPRLPGQPARAGRGGHS